MIADRRESARRFLQAGHDLWRNAEGIASDAGNQPETIASKNGRNVHVLLLLRGNSIVSACGNDRGWAVCGGPGLPPVPVGAHGGRHESCVHYIY
jgi:hypothetical protein